MSSIAKIRLGMIGCGAIAEIYHLPALEEIQGVVGNTVLAEPNVARLEAMKKKFNVATGVTDYKELVGKVDGVIVATPPASHFAICKFFLERGIPVLCEKPLTESFEQAEELVRIAESQGTKLAVNQTRRFFPTYQKIQELIAQGVLGELQSIIYHDGVEFDWPAASPHHFAPGARGAWSDTGVHLLDTVCYWLGDTPELVESINDSHGGPEAMATVRLRLNTCKIEIKVSRLGRLMNGFKIVGTKGTIEQAAEEFSEVRVRLTSGKTRVYKCGSRKQKYVHFAKPLLQNFVSVVAHKAEPFVSGRSTLGTIRLLEEAYDKSQIYRTPWNDKSRDFASFKNRQPMRILVTGASGFVGGRICELLSLSGTEVPVAAIRSWSRAARVARFKTEVVLCDIEDKNQVDAAVAGVDAIVHCAKVDSRDSIVGGTRNLLDAAVKHGIQKFVYLSTAEVYGPNVLGIVTESNAMERTGRPYADAKIEAEETCREYHAKGLQPTILRPSLIYGPFSTSWTIDVAKRLQSGNWGIFEGQCNGNANLIYVDDLANAILRCLHCEAAYGQEFNVNGPDTITWNEYFQRFNQALELPPLKKISVTQSRLRTKVMDTLGSIADTILSRFEDKLMEIYLRGGWPTRVMKYIKGELNSTPSSNELNDLFAREVIYSDEKARTILGYTPQYSLDEALSSTVNWLGQHAYRKDLIPDQSEGSSSVLNQNQDRLPREVAL